MKIGKSFLCLILAALLLGGCERGEVQEEGYFIYYKSAAQDELQTERYLPESDQPETLTDELMEKWQETPENESLVSAKPQNVSVMSYELTNNRLTVDFDEAYLELSNTEEILTRASLVRTMTQISEIRSVFITVAGEELKDDYGEEIGSMTARSFVESEELGVEGFESMDYPFYFADSEGRLEEERREIHYSTSSEKIQVVLKQLIAGTKKNDLISVISPDTRVLSSRIEDGLCTVNFSEEFNTAVEGVLPDVSIYAVVNTLCELNGVTAVKINIAGDTQSYYLNTIDLSGPLEKREDMVKTEEETQRVGVDYLMRRVTQEETNNE